MQWSVALRWLLWIFLLSALALYGTAELTGLPFEWAISAHLVVVAMYALSLVLFGSNSVLEMAIPAAIFTVLLCIALPAYRDFDTRRQVAEAAEVGWRLAQALDRQPARAIEALGVELPHPLIVRASPRSNDAFELVLGVENLEGKALLFTATQGTGKRTWTCRSSQISQKDLPHACRDKAP